MKKLIISAIVGLGLLVAIPALAAILQPFQGGTGLGTGSLGNAVPGNFLQVSTTSPFLVWTTGTSSNSGTGITSLNGSTSSTQTFATSSDTNLNLTITTASGVHTFTPVWVGTLADSRITSAATWNAKITTTSLSAVTPLSYNNTTGVFSMPTSTGSQNGFLTSTDWNTFNTKITTSSLSVAGGLLTYNNTTGVFNNSANYVSSTVAGTGIGISGATGSVTITNNGVQSLVAGTSTIISNATGTVTISSQLGLAQGIFSYSTSTSIWDDAIWIPRVASTITNISCVNQAAGDTVTLNFYYGASRNTSTSTAFKTFTSDQTLTSTSTPTNFTINASSTPGANQPVRMVASSASSTETSCSLYYKENSL